MRVGEQRAAALFAGPPAPGWAALCVPVGAAAADTHLGFTHPRPGLALSETDTECPQEIFSSRASRKFRVDMCVLAWFGSALLGRFFVTSLQAGDALFVIKLGILSEAARQNRKGGALLHENVSPPFKGALLYNFVRKKETKQTPEARTHTHTREQSKLQNTFMG